MRLAPPLALCIALSAAAVHAQVNILTWHNDNARTGQNLQEANLTPAKVDSAHFGLLFNLPVDGKVDAEPLYVSALRVGSNGIHNVLFVATEHDSVYAFDADTGAPFWKTSLLPAGETTSDSRNCGQVTPEIGVTATPAIDLGKGMLYAVAMSKDASGAYHQRIHALSLAAGVEPAGSPLAVAASVPGKGDGSDGSTVTFNPGQYKDRPGLLLVGNNLITTWGSHCDIRPYSGWMLAYDTTNGAQTGVFNFAPNGSDAAPWNAGAGPAADAAGNLYISLGNGTFDTILNSAGFPSLGDYGNSVVKLAFTKQGLQVSDYWTMYNTVSESSVDDDLGSAGLMLLPSQRDSAGAARNLAVAAGKDSNLYVLDTANLGKFNPGADSTIYQQLSGALSNGVWSSPALFNNHVYWGSVAGALRSFDVNAALLSSSPSSSSPETFAYPGTTPSVSASGGANGIVWAPENASTAVLHAYDANNLATELYSSNQAGSRDHFGSGNKFVAPAIANGKVYVGTQNSVGVFGLLRNSNPPLADGDYTLTNGASRLFLTDYFGSSDPSTEIVQYKAYGGNYQTWFFSWQGNGYYLIQNPATGLYLSSPAGGGVAAQHLQPAFNDTQLWQATAAPGGFVLQNKATGAVLTDPNSNPNPAGIQVLAAAGGANQIWAVQPAQ